MSSIDYSRWEHINASESDTEADEGVMVAPADNMPNSSQSDAKNDSISPKRLTKFEKLRSAARKFIRGRDHNDEENEEIIDILRHDAPYSPTSYGIQSNATPVTGKISRILPFIDSYELPMDTATDPQSQPLTHAYSNSNTNPSQRSSTYGFLTQFNASALSLYQVERELDVLCSVLQLPQLLQHHTQYIQPDADMRVHEGTPSTRAGTEDANEGRVLHEMNECENVGEGQVKNGEQPTAMRPRDHMEEGGWDGKSSVEGVLPPWMKVRDLSELQRAYVHDAYMQLLAHSAEWRPTVKHASPLFHTSTGTGTGTDVAASVTRVGTATAADTNADADVGTDGDADSVDNSAVAKGSASGSGSDGSGSRLCLCVGACECEEMVDRDIDWALLLEAQALLARREEEENRAEREEGEDREDREEREDGKKKREKEPAHVDRERLEKEEGMVRERENAPTQSPGETQKTEKYPSIISTSADNIVASPPTQPTEEDADVGQQAPSTSAPSQTSGVPAMSAQELRREDHEQTRLEREVMDVALRRMRAILRAWLEQRTSTIRLALTRARADARIHAPSLTAQTQPRTDTQLHSPLSLSDASPTAVARETPLSAGLSGSQSPALAQGEPVVSGETARTEPPAAARDRSSTQIEDVQTQTSTIIPENAPTSRKVDTLAQESVNGGVEDDVYLWRQDREHAWVSIWVPASTRAKDVRVSVQDGMLTLSLHRDTLLQGLLQGAGTGLLQGAGTDRGQMGDTLHRTEAIMRDGSAGDHNYGSTGSDNHGNSGNKYIVDQEHPDFFLWFREHLAYPVQDTLETEGEEEISSPWPGKAKIRENVADGNSTNIVVKRGVCVYSSTTTGTTSVVSTTMTTSSPSIVSDTMSRDTLGNLDWELRSIPGHTERLVSVQFRKCAPPGLRIWWRKATVSGKEIPVEQISGRSGHAINLLPALSGKMSPDNEKNFPFAIHGAQAGCAVVGSGGGDDDDTDLMRPRELGGFEAGALSDISHAYGERSVGKAAREKDNSHQGFESVWADAHAQLKQYVANLVPVMVDNMDDDGDSGGGDKDRDDEDADVRRVEVHVQESIGQEKEDVARSRASASTTTAGDNKPNQ